VLPAVAAQHDRTNASTRSTSPEPTNLRASAGDNSDHRATVDVAVGHQEHAQPGWSPEDGQVHRKNMKSRPLEEVLEVVAKGDADEETYWRRMYAEHHSDPAPFTRCHTCACIRTVAAYERVGWLAGSKTPVKPKAHPTQDTGAAVTKIGIGIRATTRSARQPANRRLNVWPCPFRRRAIPQGIPQLLVHPGAPTGGYPGKVIVALGMDRHTVVGDAVVVVFDHVSLLYDRCGPRAELTDGVDLHLPVANPRRLHPTARTPQLVGTEVPRCEVVGRAAGVVCPGGAARP